ncbi:Fe-S cluster assembly protein SufD [Thiolapillus brandeum]|uniref:Fe-S cluster assembly protein SufD n=1 Tax=Thiolapillus brandeum TaxID=1076588 RepID=A0A7U6GIA4_9GAMM|nr:Fe-S cluster assembly protein SufD [Thiolapillus brandeum]BAO44163.1 Fe-S cluster assembly protein SufD [Thiolapillus brandeum]
MSTSGSNWVLDILGRDSAPAPADWVARLRHQATGEAASLPPPRRKLEAWRYSRVETLLKQQAFNPVVQAPDDSGLETPVALGPHVLVFVDGWFSPGLSRTDELPREIQLGSLRDHLDRASVKQHLGRLANAGENLFTALNTALLNDGLFLEIPDDLVLETPIEVFYLNSASDTPVLAQPRNLVLMGQQAQLTLIEHFLPGQGKDYFHNGITEIHLEAGAQLAHYRMQDEARTAWHLSNLYLEQGGNSHYHGITLSFGGHWARTEYKTRFGAPHARCDLRGLYLVGDGQLSDFHLDVHHDQPGCQSREQFKGLLHSKGRAVFDGRILVERIAQGTDAQLTNDNLLLSREAEVDTKPQLEIYADDVKCSHGTTVGQLDPRQLFYLRTRGIEEQRAIQLLCQGFAGEIIDHIHLPELREQSAERLLKTLDSL